jgi:hypothetical protein
MKKTFCIFVCGVGILLFGCASKAVPPLTPRPMKDFDQSKFTDAPYVVNPIAGVTFVVGAQVPSEEAPDELQTVSVEPASFGTCELGPTCGIDLTKPVIPTQLWEHCDLGNMECANYVVIVRDASGARIVSSDELVKLLLPIDTPREAELITFHSAASRKVTAGYEVYSEYVDCDQITVTVREVHADGTSQVVRTYYQAPDPNTAC